MNIINAAINDIWWTLKVPTRGAPSEEAGELEVTDVPVDFCALEQPKPPSPRERRRGNAKPGTTRVDLLRTEFIVGSSLAASRSVVCANSPTLGTGFHAQFEK